MTGDVLLPSRAADCLTYNEPPPRLREANTGLTIAFAGSLGNVNDIRMLESLAKILLRMGGRLLIFGQLTTADARRAGLDGCNIEIGGLLKSNDLIRRFRDEIDVLFVSMSFDPADRANVEISFPSKLADYTAAGLPLLIQGPDYCSAVRWAVENPGVAEVVTRNDPDSQAAALERLCVPSHRIALADNAIRNGNEFFSHSTSQRIFLARLTHTKTN